MAGITGINSVNSVNYSSYGSLFNTSAVRSPYGNAGGADSVYWRVSGTSALSSNEAKTFLAAVKDFGGKLREATLQATRSSQSIFSKLTAASSKDESLAVSVTNQSAAAKLFSAKDDQKVSIQQLASAQKNTGASVNAASLSGANSGTNRFTIEKDGKTTSFSVNINVSDSARTAQQKMADAINSKKTGVTATVNYDSKTGKSSLTLTSSETGAKNAFTIRDDEGQGNLVQKLGVGEAAEQARDAVYTVDGEERTSEKNTVDIGGGITGTLKKAGPDEISVTVKKDVESIKDAVRDITDNFNGLLRTAKNSSDRGAQALRQRLDSIAESYAPSLRNIGITRDKDGYLATDDNKLTKAFENGAAERNLGSSSYGFTQRLSQIATQADTNPGQFLSGESRRALNAKASDTADYTEQLYLRFMSSSRNVQLANAGLLLNMVV